MFLGITKGAEAREAASHSRKILIGLPQQRPVGAEKLPTKAEERAGNVGPQGSEE